VKVRIIFEEYSTCYKVNVNNRTLTTENNLSTLIITDVSTVSLSENRKTCIRRLYVLCLKH
jgi:hypothetical protein